jgi:hypothetical protein
MSENVFSTSNLTTSCAMFLIGEQGVSIKNLQFDQWKLSEVLTLLEGGNGNYERYFNTQSPRNLFRRKDDGVVSPEQMLDRRYTGKIAVNYKQQLMQRARKVYSDREPLIQLYFLNQRGGQRRGRNDFESLSESCHSHSTMSEESANDRYPPRNSVKFGNLPDNPPEREYNGMPTTSKILSPHAVAAASRGRTPYVDQPPRSSAVVPPQSSNEGLSRVQLMQLARSSSNLSASSHGLTAFTSLRSLRDSEVKPTTSRRVAATAAFAQYQRLAGK